MKCPHCHQPMPKAYKRKITLTMGKALCVLYKETQYLPVYTHTPTLLKRYGINPADSCMAHLTYWGLVEAQKNTDTPKRKGKGMWIITGKGIDFVEGKITLPKYLEVLNNEVVRELGAELVGIKDVSEFDFSEIKNTTNDLQESNS